MARGPASIEPRQHRDRRPTRLRGGISITRLRTTVATTAADAFLAGLDPEQEAAVRITRGPLVIHAGAGSGKTRVISHRVAYAVATGAVERGRVLVVTFTDKAAAEMAGRLRDLGLPGVATRTFHAAANLQLRHFWSSRHDGAPPPSVLASKAPLLVPLIHGLPGGYRFTPAKDLADEIEWAKSRRLTPASYADAAAAQGRDSPIPADLFAALWAGYERAKDRSGQIDFDDMLIRTVELLEADEEAAAVVRARYTWFSVDEYQDTNPLQERLLGLWMGPREDLCVVGDEDQTIYSFTGASPRFLLEFRDRFPAAREVILSRNYRSTPQVLGLANRLLAAEGRRKVLVPTRESGPPTRVQRCRNGDAEMALVADHIRTLIAGGTPAAEIAVLVRTNAQLPPIEEALTLAGVPFQLRGQGFFARREVRDALRLLRRLAADLRGSALSTAFERRLGSDLGMGLEEPGEPIGPRGAEARERDAALRLLAQLVADTTEDPMAGPAAIVDALEARATAEAQSSASGVNLLTLHRSKGLEWDAVFLPGLEEGCLPIRQADTPEAVAEERRLLYVGLTRARQHLLLSWAEFRTGPGDRESRRRPSRFLADLVGNGPGGGGVRRVTDLGGPGQAGRPAAQKSTNQRSPRDQALFEALRAWRLDHARREGKSAFIIAADSLLEALVERRPDSIAALRRIPGMGPGRLERYGSELLGLIAAADRSGD
jgi:DNA helicase-2/ATP-dependent DNA helicase PcrA